MASKTEHDVPAPAATTAPTKLFETGESIVQSLQKLYEVFSKADWKPFLRVFSDIAEQGRKADLVSDSGWLPHHTTPFDRLDLGDGASLAVAEIDTSIADYYRDNWDAVSEKLRAQLAGYAIDDEAKAVFREALDIHGAGFYRAAPRLLFPEIERVASDEFFEGKRRLFTETARGKRSSVLITRLKEIRSSLRRLPAGDIFAFECGWQLFTKLEEHLYEEVGDDPEVRARFAADPVPNRHGALHGIIIYRDMKTSLNAIIMTDFLFHMLSRLKMRVQQSDTAGAKDPA